MALIALVLAPRGVSSATVMSRFDLLYRAVGITISMAVVVIAVTVLIVGIGSATWIACIGAKGGGGGVDMMAAT
jgi:hypothetical protein